MQPVDLTPQSFARYPPRARRVAVAYLPTLHQMPLPLLGIVLRQLIAYDWSFPAEQKQLDSQLAWLQKRSPATMAALMTSFRAIELSPELRRFDWINEPHVFSEKLSAELWASNRIDAYHQAALQYQAELDQAFNPVVPEVSRLTCVVIGKECTGAEDTLFRRLRKHGTLFKRIDPTDGMDILLAELASRAKEHVSPFAHWYIDGGEPRALLADAQGVTRLSYTELAPAALREFHLLRKMPVTTAHPVNAEQMTAYMAQLKPEDLGLTGTANGTTMDRFATSVLTEGAGCQIFSTTFVQWACRQCLARAQPLTLVARYSTRQVLAPMERLLAYDPLSQTQDTTGSFIDADMGVYYTWIYQSKLSGAENAMFPAWFEGRGVALAVSPNLPGGTESPEKCNIEQLLKWIT